MRIPGIVGLSVPNGLNWHIERSRQPIWTLQFKMSSIRDGQSRALLEKFSKNFFTITINLARQTLGFVLSLVIFGTLVRLWLITLPENANMYFNHLIKPQEQKAHGMSIFPAFHGARCSCSRCISSTGVQYRVLPVLARSIDLDINKVGFIIVQVKNDPDARLSASRRRIPGDGTLPLWLSQ